MALIPSILILTGSTNIHPAVMQQASTPANLNIHTAVMQQASTPANLNIHTAVMQQASTPANLNIHTAVMQQASTPGIYTGPPMAQFLRDNKIEGGQQSLTVIGHRGSGQNKEFCAGDAPTMENTLKSFALAAENGADFVEFDVQVTKDGHAVIFHDDYIITDGKGLQNAWRIEDLTLEEYHSMGFEADGQEIQRPLDRKADDVSICKWIVNVQDRLCTLRDAFEKVPLSVGFNIELKFDDEIEVSEVDLKWLICTVLKEVAMYGKGRKVFYSSFNPDAVDLLRKLQTEYPVLFLTEGGTYVYKDGRKNSIESAVEVCLKCGLQGIVSDVRPIFQNPGLVSKVKDAGLCLLTYGELNNFVEAVQKHTEMGVDGVIVDRVEEMVSAVRNATISDSTLT